MAEACGECGWADGGVVRGEQLGRFYQSLRTSYTSQWNRGLLGASSFAKLRWAVDKALDHLKDEEREDEAVPKDLMEWGWLLQQKSVDVSWVARRLKATPGLVSVGDAIEHRELREHYEMISGVIR